MQGKLILTKVWHLKKLEFLNRHEFKGQCLTWVKRIDFLMENNLPSIIDELRAYFLVDTQWPDIKFASLACVCAIKKNDAYNLDYAPAALYFPGAKRTENLSDIAKALMEVRAELGW